MDQIRILIADDHPLIRQGLIKVIRLDPLLNVVGEAADGEDVVEKSGQLQPHIIIMDLNMPKMDGLEATKQIKQKFPEIKVIALTVEDSEQKVVSVIRAGVSGYVLKDVDPDALAATIKAVYKGEMVIHPRVTAMLCRELEQDDREPNTNHRQHAVDPGSFNENLKVNLTSREIQILKYIASGVHNKDIARLLYISEKTVKNHITNIFRKLNVEDRTQAVISAVKLKLVNL
ncbi:response regulator [Phosphitispora sp. TUW77]|uniref:response regulator n=1 Tax=Phosphitispora sp. TUW77 TaxID=3152361 RepID=UPI003AB158D8